MYMSTDYVQRAAIRPSAHSTDLLSELLLHGSETNSFCIFNTCVFNNNMHNTCIYIYNRLEYF